MNKSKKSFLIILLVLIVLAVAVCAIFFATKKDQPEISLEKAQEIALEDASESKNKVTTLTTNYDSEDNEYEVEFITSDATKKYEFTISGRNGKIKEKNFETISSYSSQYTPQENSGSSAITLEEAKSIAVKDAGFQESEVTFVKQTYDKSDNEYDIEFTAKDKSDSKTYKHEYDISGVDGKIVNKEKDTDLN